MSKNQEWIKCFSKRRQLDYWFNTKTQQSIWKEPIYSKKYNKYYYYDSKTNNCIWIDSYFGLKKEIIDDSIEQKNIEEIKTNIDSNKEKTLLNKNENENENEDKSEKKINSLLIRMRKKKLEKQKNESNKKLNEKDSIQQLKKNQNNSTRKNNEVDEISKDIGNMNINNDSILSNQKHKHEIKTKKYAVSNGLGHYHEYDAPSHWDKHDHMDYLRDLRDSMNPYD